MSLEKPNDNFREMTIEELIRYNNECILNDENDEQTLTKSTKKHNRKYTINNRKKKRFTRKVKMHN